jgi:rSAM/selenodomain-associated transferase 1
VSDRTLVVLVKEPRPGTVKTRLIPALGAEGAASVYRALVEGVLRATLPEPGDYERLVFYDPPEAGEAMRAWLPGGRLRRQSEGDLGARMNDAFARTFARGARAVAVVGSDVPELSREDVLAAFEALVRADVVLGPAPDGGYYLIALRAAQPALFSGVEWSTPAVLEQTLERARRAGLSVEQLPAHRDLDTLEDLKVAWPRVRTRLDRDLRLRLSEVLDRG